MRSYNTQTESERGDQLRSHLEKMAKWYRDQYLRFNQTFQSELNMELADKEIYEMTGDYNLDYEYGFDAILSPFCVSDFLAKHILSTYSYGPEVVGANINISYPSGISWFDYKADAPTIIELAQEYLNMNSEGSDLELGILLEERQIRSSLTHSGSLELCMSIIRYYNVIRKMLIFMNSDYEKTLEEFSYPSSISCDVQGLLEHFGFDDFQNRTTILVVGSLHDIPKTYQLLLANLPWNIVIDFDASSSNGGLRSAANTGTINDRYWDLSTVGNVAIRNNLTEWFKCGDYIYPASGNKLTQIFPSRNGLNLGTQKYYRWTSQVFDKLFRQIAGEQNPVSILFLYHDSTVLEKLIDNAEQHLASSVSYKLASAYYWGEEKRQNLVNTAYVDDISMGNDYSDRFQMYPCSIKSFFTGFAQYYSAPQINLNEQNCYRLPGADGETEVPHNLQIRLEKYFDVLYTNCGNEDYQISQKKIQEFHSGAIAPWCAFENDEVVNLISDADYDRWKNKVKSTLGRMQEGGKKVLHLVHRPGIGGTTMLRYLGWEFHKEYPVLVAQKYSRTDVKNVLQDLYDQQSRAFIVLADDDYNDLADLETDIKVLPRPCVLIIAHRNTTTAAQSQALTFSSITSDAENRLKYKFKKISSLTETEMKEKEDGYNEFIQTDPSMKSPFFIGLYYLDKDFKHLPDYVARAFKGIYKDEEYRALGYIAFCNIYGGGTLPKIFINKIMGLTPGKSYLETTPHAKSILYQTKANGTTVSYQSKHILISQEVLDICSNHLFQDGYRNMLVKWSDQFIDDVAKELKISFQENYRVIFERIFTRTKDTNGDFEDFSKLIQDVAVPEYREQILAKLARTAEEIALINDPETTPAAYVMAAHCYGHLGRLYSKGGGISPNYSKAVECCKKALDFSEKCHYQDYAVYHMYGDVKRLRLKDKYQTLIKYDDLEISNDDFKEIEDEIEDTLRQYDISDEYGNHAYAQSTSILLLMEYLEFVYHKKGIDSVEKMYYLSETQSSYKLRIEDLFDSVDWDNLDSKNLELFSDLRDRYDSGIMYHDYSHMEVYHQNKLEYMLSHQGSISDICMHRNRLVLAKLAKNRTILPNGKVSYMSVQQKDVETILTLLEQGFEQNVDTANFRDRRNRCSDYRRWMTLAKYSDRPIEKGIIYAKAWINLEEKGADHDPIPYYYLATLSYLSALEGNKDSIFQAESAAKQACNYASNRTESIYKIKDVLIKGKGMGQLRDISVFENIGALETYETITPVVFSGRFDTVESARGSVMLRTPLPWLGCKAKFTVRENNQLTKDFITHNVEFYGGFSYESLVAINSSVVDITANETIAMIKKIDFSQPAPAMKFGKVSAGKKQSDSITDFIPHDIHDLESGDFIIQGSVYGAEGGLHSRNLPEKKEHFNDEREFAEFIISLQKMKVNCKGMDERGRYRVTLPSEDISIEEMREYGTAKLPELSVSTEKLEEEKQELSVAIEHLKMLPDISGNVIFYDIQSGNKCVTGKIKYNNVVYGGKITSNVTQKNIRDWMKKKKISVRVISKTDKEYIVKPVN